MRIAMVVLVLLVFALQVEAKEISGVVIPEVVTMENGSALHLNGAGIRSKLFFDIYIAQLYLQNPGNDAGTVIADEGSKRVVMHFLYDEVGRDKLVDGWNDGFEGNCTAEQLATLKERIAQFNALFETVKSGDTITFDYTPGQGTVVEVSGEQKGIIDGKDFNDALLAIWLGKDPVSSSLRKDLLSYSK